MTRTRTSSNLRAIPSQILTPLSRVEVREICRYCWCVERAIESGHVGPADAWIMASWFLPAEYFRVRQIIARHGLESRPKDWQVGPLIAKLRALTRTPLFATGESGLPGAAA